MNSKNILLLTYLIFIFHILTLSTLAQNMPFDWVKQIGGPSNERGFAIEKDSFGNIYCAGEVSDSVFFADTVFVTNFADAFISKFSNNGNLLWVKTCGGTGLDRGLDMKIDNNDNIIITGFFSGSATFGDTSFTSSDRHDLYVVKFNSDGDFLWAVHGAGIGDDEGTCLAIDLNNNILVSGFFENSLNFGSYSLSTSAYETAFLTKISQSGNVLWAEQVIGQDFGESNTLDIICDSNGDLLFTGYFDDTIIFQDTTLYSFDGSEDVFLAKYNTSGTKIWVLQAGGNYDDAGNAITVDQSNNIYLTGEFSNTASFGDSTFISTDSNADLFISKISSNGQFQWSKHASGAQKDWPNAINYNSQNGITICGGFASDFTIGDSTFTSNPICDVFIATFTPSGDFQNAISFGNNGYDYANDVLLTNNNNAYLIGRFEQSIDIGNITLVSHSIADIFITKVNLDYISNLNNDYETVLPSNYELLQNYPNPFNPTTTIEYFLHKKGQIELVLFNISGQKIQTLYSGIKSTGNHKFLLDASHLASGLYFIQLQAGDFTAKQKILLVK